MNDANRYVSDAPHGRDGVPEPRLRGDLPSVPVDPDASAEMKRLREYAEWGGKASAYQFALDEIERLQVALSGVLDVAERYRQGDPLLNPEEWFAARDYARVVLTGGPHFV